VGRLSCYGGWYDYDSGLSRATGIYVPAGGLYNGYSVVRRSFSSPFSLSVTWVRVWLKTALMTVFPRSAGFVVHAINPKQLDRFRDRFSPAGAKDDRRDAPPEPSGRQPHAAGPPSVQPPPASPLTSRSP